MRSPFFASFWVALLCCATLCSVTEAQCSQPCVTSPLLPLAPGMTVSTVSSALPGSMAPPFVVYVHDVRDPALNAPGLDTNWFAPHDNNQASGQEWTNAILGEVFGVCLDDQAAPNIYVAATTIYATQGTGIGSSGAVYRIDGITGAVCVAAELPNNDGAGLGNICFDRQNQQFFVANVDDGLIYRFDGAELLCGTGMNWDSTFDHGRDGRPDEGLSVIADTPGSGWTPVGRRVFAVQKHPTESRLYYSVWWENGETPNPNPIEDNEIWSIELDANGDFVLGTARREIVTPHPTGQIEGGIPAVTDIDFSPLTCDMAAAERSMTGTVAGTTAHGSSVNIYTGNTTSWTAAACPRLRVGAFLTEQNSAGGVSFDCDGHLWVTGDALHFNSCDRIYGLQRIDLADNCADATATSNAYLVDIDCDLADIDKLFIGDVDIYRPNCVASCDPGGPCMTVDYDIECRPDGSYAMNFQITNNSGVDAERIRLLPLGAFNFTPNIFIGNYLDGTTTNVSTVLSGVVAGESICFEVWLLDDNFQQCCVQEICLDVPTCCLSAQNIQIECLADGTFSVTFEVVNNSPFPVDRIFLWPLPPTPFVFSVDSYILGTPILQGQSSGTLSTVISGANPGDVICFDISIHDSTTGDCCADKVTLQLPDCNPCDRPDICKVPGVVSLCPVAGAGLSATFPVTICNKCDQGTVEYEITFTPVLNCGDVPFDPSWFSPTSVITPPVAPGACVDTIITVSVPPALFAPGNCACFNVNFLNLTTGNVLSCPAKLCLPQLPIKVIGPADPVGVPFGEAVPVDIQIQSTGQGVSFDYEIRTYIPGTIPPFQRVSLNGLPPATPILGSIDLPGGGATGLQPLVSFVDHEPFVFYDIILLVSPAGEDDMQPVAAFPVRSVFFQDCDGDGVSDDIAIALGFVSDDNNNGIPDSCEGLPLLPSFLRGDSNGDSVFDMADPLHLLAYIFQGQGAPSCLAATDFDNDADIKLNDVVAMLLHLSGNSSTPAAPFPTCGPATFSPLSCANSSCP